MPKRKRTVEETVEDQLSKFGQELHHALKLAKGFERQRQAKRLKDSKATPEKKERLQKEIVVLKVCPSIYLYELLLTDRDQPSHSTFIRQPTRTYAPPSSKSNPSPQPLTSLPNSKPDLQNQTYPRRNGSPCITSQVRCTTGRRSNRFWRRPYQLSAAR